VLDAGHGGHDGGASANGIREKDVVLAVTKKVGHYVEDRLGIRVVYTRDDDTFVPLHERGRIANESCGKLFVSIHANAAGSRSAHGSETYFLGLHKSQSAADVMERENSVVALESDPDLYAGFGDAEVIVQTLATTAYQRESERLASLIQGQFEHRVDRPSRGVKQAGFLVLWRASMPAVLIELGFVTNPSEARFLRSENGQDLLASAIFRSIRDYKEQYERGLRFAAY
jgi:N-acetylmuramoyl-L-alanine amidase